MARSRIAGGKAVGVGHHELVVLGRDPRPFGVDDARVQGERRSLAGARTLDRFIDGQIPGMEQVEVMDLARHQLGFGEAGTVVARGKARDADRRRHRVGERLGREIRGAGKTLALAEVGGDAYALVAVVLYGCLLYTSDAADDLLCV